jgi:hypothetical protein
MHTIISVPLDPFELRAMVLEHAEMIGRANSGELTAAPSGDRGRARPRRCRARRGQRGPAGAPISSACCWQPYGVHTPDSRQLSLLSDVWGAAVTRWKPCGYPTPQAFSGAWFCRFRLCHTRDDGLEVVTLGHQVERGGRLIPIMAGLQLRQLGHADRQRRRLMPRKSSALPATTPAPPLHSTYRSWQAYAEKEV